MFLKSSAVDELKQLVDYQLAADRQIGNIFDNLLDRQVLF